MTGPFQNTGSHQRESVHSAELTPMTASNFQSNVEKLAISVGISHHRLFSALEWNREKALQLGRWISAVVSTKPPEILHGQISPLPTTKRGFIGPVAFEAK